MTNAVRKIHTACTKANRTRLLVKKSFRDFMSWYAMTKYMKLFMATSKKTGRFCVQKVVVSSVTVHLLWKNTILDGINSFWYKVYIVFILLFLRSLFHLFLLHHQYLLLLFHFVHGFQFHPSSFMVCFYISFFILMFFQLQCTLI